MHQAMVAIILSEIKLKFKNEENFCKNYLNISTEEWEHWKQGTGTLSQGVMQKVKGLFSDYEWMLVNKVGEQAMFFPEKRHYVVQEFRRLKTMIAKCWIKLPPCHVELITQSTTDAMEETINLKVTMRYGEWGYDDILNFAMPAQLAKQIEGTNKGLLEWVNKDLIHVYVENNEENKE